MNRPFTVLLDRVSQDRHNYDMPYPELRALTRRLSSASTLEEALAAGTETAFVLLRPSFAAVSNRFEGDTMRACARVGPHANHSHRPIQLSAGWQRRCPAIYGCSCDPHTPIERSPFSPAAKECFPTLRPCSALLANVSVNGMAIANVGISWKDLHLHEPYEREVLLTIASLLECSMKSDAG